MVNVVESGLENGFGKIVVEISEDVYFEVRLFNKVMIVLFLIVMVVLFVVVVFLFIKKEKFVVFELVELNLVYVLVENLVKEKFILLNV